MKIRSYYYNRENENINEPGYEKQDVYELKKNQDGTFEVVTTGEVKDLQVDIDSHHDSSILKNLLRRFNKGELGLVGSNEGLLYEDMSDISHIREENLQRYKELEQMFNNSTELRFAYKDLKGMLKNELREEYKKYYEQAYKSSTLSSVTGSGVDTQNKTTQETQEDKKGNINTSNGNTGRL